jgi:hypothetical protein
MRFDYSKHQYQTLNRCASEFEQSRFESWSQLREFKRRYTLPRVELRRAVRERRIPARVLWSAPIRLFNKIARYARQRAKRTEQNWRLFGVGE